MNAVVAPSPGHLWPGQPTGSPRSAALREALNGCVERLLERHLSVSKEWFPHELVPWEQGRRFKPGEPFEPEGEPLAPGVTSALYINLLTEDNLPHYFHAIAEVFGAESAWGEWTRRWTAEEQRHAIVMRDWLCLTRKMDMVALERARMRQVSYGFRAGGRAGTVADGLVYLTLQELATRISHWNTGRALDAEGFSMLKRVAADENLHFLFYRDLTTEALAIDPSGTVQAIDRQVRAFQMPGDEMEGFSAHAAAIAGAGIYDFRIHYEQVIEPVVVGQWRLDALEGLDAEGEKARDRLFKWVPRLRRVADRMASQSGPVGACQAAPASAP